MTRTTVLIPLHRSAGWQPVIAGNIERLADHCLVIVSDAHEHDDALTDLRARFSTVASVRFVGARDLQPGWIAHVNDLMSMVRTPYAMWLPHDDEIGADWIIEGERALDRRPDAVAACGSLVSSAHSDAGMAGSLHPDRVLGSRSRVRRLARAVSHIERGDPALLGLLFRSVLRRDAVPPLPVGDEHGSWSDIYWALRLLSRGAAVPITARYAKTWHAASTVQRWTDARDDREQLRHDIDQALAELPRRTRAVVDWRARRRPVGREGAGS